MSIYEEVTNYTTAYEKICLNETNERFLLIVTLISMINVKFYNPVAFFIEYLQNKKTQELVNHICGTNNYQFIIDYMQSHPNILQSRKVNNAIKKLNI